MEFKSQELLNAAEKPSSYTVIPKESLNRDVVVNELKKYFLLQQGKANIYFDIGALYNNNDNINPLFSITNALEQYYMQKVKESNNQNLIEETTKTFDAIKACVHLIDRIDRELHIQSYKEVIALFGGIISKNL